MKEENTTKNNSAERPPAKVLERLIPGEKVIRTFFIPYKTTSVFGLILWTLQFFLPLYFLVLSHNSAEISENTRTFIDILMGIWLVLSMSLLLLFGYGERYLILTDKRVIFYREFYPLFIRKLKMVRQYSAKVADVTLVERKQYRHPDLQTWIIGNLLIFAGIITWIFEEIAAGINQLTETEEYWLKVIALLLVIIGGIILLLNLFFFSRKYYEVAVAIGQTFPLPIMVGRLISFNVKSGYWVISGWREDAKEMYEQFHNLIFELQESQ